MPLWVSIQNQIGQKIKEPSINYNQIKLDKMKLTILTKATSNILILLMFISINACKIGDVKDIKPINLKGKIAPTMLVYGDMGFFDLRDANNPKKATFSMKGDVNTFTLEFVNSKPIGAKANKSNYGNLSIPANIKFYLADKNWPNWSNISAIGNYLVMNNDNTAQLYSQNQIEEGKTKLTNYTDYFVDYNTKGNWGQNGTINASLDFYEDYGNPGNLKTSNTFYLNLQTQKYLFQGSSGAAFDGYKFTDLIKKPNGNMDTDPIDWTKADIVFATDDNLKSFTYNGKKVSIIIFIDLDTKTYAKVLRNLEDDVVNGADKGRQTLLTTSWQPLSNLIKGWDL